MRLASNLIGILLLSSCSGGATNELTLATADGPNPSLIARIEAKLSADACLSNIASMRREYRYLWRDGKVLRDFIDVKVQEAGVDGLPAGRFVEDAKVQPRFDDRDYFVAFATYTVRGDALDLWSCGRNIGGSIRHKPIF
ncbi:hypothetical protein GCM10009532_31100 [Microbacterium aurantiacum]